MKEKIIFLTKECGIVTSQIAKQAGIPISSLSKWLNGTRSSLTEENE